MCEREACRSEDTCRASISAWWWQPGLSVRRLTTQGDDQFAAARHAGVRRQGQRARRVLATIEQPLLKHGAVGAGAPGQQPISHQRRGTAAFAGGAPGLKGEWQVQLALRRVRCTEPGGEAGGEGIVERRRVGEWGGQAEAAEEQGFGVHVGVPLGMERASWLRWLYSSNDGWPCRYIGQDFMRCGNGLTRCSGLQPKTLGSQSAWFCPEAREGAAWMNFESGSSLMD